MSSRCSASTFGGAVDAYGSASQAIETPLHPHKKLHNNNNKNNNNKLPSSTAHASLSDSHSGGQLSRGIVLSPPDTLSENRVGPTHPPPPPPPPPSNAMCHTGCSATSASNMDILSGSTSSLLAWPAGSSPPPSVMKIGGLTVQMSPSSAAPIHLQSSNNNNSNNNLLHQENIGNNNHNNSNNNDNKINWNATLDVVTNSSVLRSFTNSSAGQSSQQQNDHHRAQHSAPGFQTPSSMLSSTLNPSSTAIGDNSDEALPHSVSLSNNAVVLPSSAMGTTQSAQALPSFLVSTAAPPATSTLEFTGNPHSNPSVLSTLPGSVLYWDPNANVYFLQEPNWSTTTSSPPSQPAALPYFASLPNGMCAPASPPPQSPPIFVPSHTGNVQPLPAWGLHDGTSTPSALHLRALPGTDGTAPSHFHVVPPSGKGIHNTAPSPLALGSSMSSSPLVFFHQNTNPHISHQAPVTAHTGHERNTDLPRHNSSVYAAALPTHGFPNASPSQFVTGEAPTPRFQPQYDASLNHNNNVCRTIPNNNCNLSTQPHYNPTSGGQLSYTVPTPLPCPPFLSTEALGLPHQNHENVPVFQQLQGGPALFIIPPSMKDTTEGAPLRMNSVQAMHRREVVRKPPPQELTAEEWRSTSVSSFRFQQIIMQQIPELYQKLILSTPKSLPHQKKIPFVGRWAMFATTVLHLRCFWYTPDDYINHPSLACHITLDEIRCAWKNELPETALQMDARIGQLLWDKYLRWEYLLPVCLKIIGDCIQDRSTTYGVPPFIPSTSSPSTCTRGAASDIDEQQPHSPALPSRRIAMERIPRQLAYPSGRIEPDMVLQRFLFIPQHRVEQSSSAGERGGESPVHSASPAFALLYPTKCLIPNVLEQQANGSGKDAEPEALDAVTPGRVEEEEVLHPPPEGVSAALAALDGMTQETSRRSSAQEMDEDKSAVDLAQAKLKLYQLVKEISSVLVMQNPIFSALVQAQLRTVIQCILAHVLTHDVSEGPPPRVPEEGEAPVFPTGAEALNPLRGAPDSRWHHSLTGKMRSKHRAMGVDPSITQPSRFRPPLIQTSHGSYREFSSYGYTCETLLDALLHDTISERLILRVHHLQRAYTWWNVYCNTPVSQR